MKINKSRILKNHCYTELVYSKINKKLGASFSKQESETLIKKILEETDLEYYKKTGKNFYVTSKKYTMNSTINSNTFRVITVNKI